MDDRRHIVQVYVGAVSQQYEALSIEVHKTTLAQEIVACIAERLEFPNANNYYLAEVVHNAKGEECKERRLASDETPACLQGLWPQNSISHENEAQEYRFCLREKPEQQSCEPSPYESQIIRDYFKRFLHTETKEKEHPDLCQLSNLTEETLLQNLKVRFENGLIYTYVGSILISVNPFKYYPIYNPKYVKIYQNHRMGELPPHIFAIADSAYHSMVKQRKNQCIVISGESGSGKTESTLFLLHHLTMLSQKGSHGSGVEQTILSSGPVLEAFGNAKTKHNNNSSRFGKFIQVSYKENGLVQGACVQKYLLEKSRICSQALNERSYHVFYYLLAGATPQERTSLNLLRPKDYNYLNQSKCYNIEGCDEQFEFLRLKQSMEMVGFTTAKQQRLFSVLSAVLLLGNVEFHQPRGAYQHDESVMVRNTEVVSIVASLLGVANNTLLSALTAKRTVVQGEVLIINYRLSDAVMARNALAKCLYGALFDWIVLQLNYSLLSLKDHTGDKSTNSIGVLDIFGFEDFPGQNRFEQFCINYANERLQRYFNQHVFEYEQEEYQREGIPWKHIEFQDNVDCLALIEAKRTGLLCILDDQCNFPGSTDETFLEKINSVHKDNPHYGMPQRRESAFIINHYAGPVKYQVSGIREKNLDLMRPEVITVLKHSQYSVVRELAGADPVAVYRWAILRAFFRAVNAFRDTTIKNDNNSSRRGSQGRSKYVIDQSRINAALESSHNRLRRTRYSRSSSSGLNNRLRSSTCSSARNKSLQTVKALAQRTQGRGGRKQTYTVTGQFQLSLQALMDTLSQANPYFIRCIKSNANKEANVFDDALVMRQLRYTGMLETVRIRQAGYSVRLTYDEFIQHYRILLPKGLLSSQADVKAFLCSGTAGLDRNEHQEGRTRIFMRESERSKLNTLLHHTILNRILLIQRWYRAVRQRRHFLNLRAAALRIQCCVRRWLAEQHVARLQLQHRAAALIQRVWRGYRQRCVFLAIRRAVLAIQCGFRGNAARARFKVLVEAARQRHSVPHEQLPDDGRSSISTLVSNLSSDAPPPDHVQRRPTVALPDQSSSKREPAEESDKVDSKVRLELIRRASTEDSDDKSSAASRKSSVISQVNSIVDPETNNYTRRKASDESVGLLPPRNQKKTIGKSESDFNLVTNRSSLPEPANDSNELLGSIVLKNELAKRHHSSCDVMSEHDNRSVIAAAQRPPPRRRSAANIAAPEHVGVAGVRRQSEQYRAGQRLAAQRSVPLDTEASVSAESSPPSSPGEGSVGGESRPPGKTKSFRHRHYPKVAPPSLGHAKGPAYASEDSLTEAEDRSPTAQNDAADHLLLFPVRPRAGVPAVPAKSSSLPNESVFLGTQATKQKYNIKRTFKNIMGKGKEGAGSVYPADDDNISVSTTSEGSVPLTPILQTTLPLAYISAPSFESSLPPDFLCSGTREDTSATLEVESLSSSESSSAVSSAHLKKILASSVHSLKQSQLKKGDVCGVCDGIFTNRLFNPGFKCIVCRRVFHQRCLDQSSSIQCSRNSSSLLIPSGNRDALAGTSPPLYHRHSISVSGKKAHTTPALHRPSAAGLTDISAGSGRADNQWNLKGSSQFEDRTIEVVRNKEQLQALERFISLKLHGLKNAPHKSGQEGRGSNANDGPAAIMAESDKKDSQVDQVFTLSLHTFKEMLLSDYSGCSSDTPVLSYKDLTNKFEKMMESTARQHESGCSSFPVTMGVNAFRGFLNEFMAENATAKKRRRRTNRRKKKEKKPTEEIVHGSHKFTHLLINIATSCEVCNSFLWLSAKGLTCSSCKLTCHEKCLPSVDVHCSPNAGKAVITASATKNKSQQASSSGANTSGGAVASRVYGVPLEKQLLVNGVPLVVDRLIQAIEHDGLFTEGLYRKSAATSKVREVKALIEEDCAAVQYAELPVHVLTTLLKAFLRELPEPLLTYDAYDPLLHASHLPDVWEQQEAAYKIISNLPELNLKLTSRLFFHLAKVAHLEQHNRMNCNSLAIVFSPCIIRCNRSLPVPESLSDVSKQTLIIERAISKRLEDYRDTLSRIERVDSEAASTAAKLHHLRESKKAAQRQSSNPVAGSNVKPDPRMALHEYNLEERLSTLEDARELLEDRLPEILPGGSSEEDTLDLSRAGSEEDINVDTRRKDLEFSERNLYRVGVRSEAEREAPLPNRRPALGRQLSEDSQLRARSGAALLGVEGKENIKRRRHIAPSNRTLPPDDDEDDDTVMV